MQERSLGTTRNSTQFLERSENPLRNFRIKKVYVANVRFEWESHDGQSDTISYALDRDVQKFHVMDAGYSKEESSILLQALFEKLNEMCVVKETKRESQRDEIISSMCYSLRHDYGLIKDENENSLLSSGMTEKERKALWANMAQIYDNVIVPKILKNENN